MNKNESKYFNTAKKMDDALLSLLEKKTFEYITIKDICEEANVNRSTFYLHYDNLNDLLEEVISNTNADFYEAFSFTERKDVASSNLNELNFINDSYLLPYLEFVRKHKRVYQEIKNNSSLFRADRYKKEIYQDFVNQILDKFGIDDKYKEYLFDFFVSGIQSIVARWLKNDCDLEVQEVANLIKTLVRKDEGTIKESQSN